MTLSSSAAFDAVITSNSDNGNTRRNRVYGKGEVGSRATVTSTISVIPVVRDRGVIGVIREINRWINGDGITGAVIGNGRRNIVTASGGAELHKTSSGSVSQRGSASVISINSGGKVVRDVGVIIIRGHIVSDVPRTRWLRASDRKHWRYLVADVSRHIG